MKKPREMLVADLFCGAGGSSTGARRALETQGLKMKLVAVNHWPIAIETHQKNHPDARHYCVDLDAARPEDIVPEGRLDLLMASPECTHHSRARGGKPIHDQSRMSAWHVIRWATTLYVKRILIENVREFREWAPLGANGRPLKSKKGEAYQAFIGALERLGYRVEDRVMVSADYGDATTRERLYIMARRDGKKIIWPAPAYAKHGLPHLFDGEKQSWKSARKNVIDWSIEGKSIFTRKKSLAPNTIRRIAAGLEKFGGANAAPYLALLCMTGMMPSVNRKQSAIIVGEGNDDLAQLAIESFLVNRHGENGSGRVHPIDSPLPTVTTRGAGYVVEPHIEPLVGANRTNNVPHPVDEPVPSIVTSGNLFMVEPSAESVDPFTLGQQSCAAPRTVGDPLPTISTAGAISLVEPIISTFNGNSNGHPRACRSIEEPLPTVTTEPRFGLIEPIVVQIDQTGSNGGCSRSVQQPLPTLVTKANVAVIEPSLVQLNGGGCLGPGGSRSIDLPVPAIVAGGNHIGLVEPVMVNMKGKSDAISVDDPAPTITAHARHLAVAEPFLAQVNHGDGKGTCDRRVKSLESPLPTITTHHGMAVVEPFLAPYYGEGSGKTGTSVEEPLDTVTSKARHALVEPMILPQFSSSSPKSVNDPIGSITTTSRGVGLVEPYIVPQFGEREGQPPRTHSLEAPLPAVTSHGAGALVEPQVVVMGQQAIPGDLRYGLPTVASIGIYALVDPKITRQILPEKGGHLIYIYGLLYHLDILFRMLRNRELARAMGFSDEEAEYEFVGTQEQVTKQIGNAVPVNTAAALVGAFFSDVVIARSRRGKAA